MDERVIDLRSYLEGKGSGRTHFGVFGGEGTRARFALPAWRAVSLVGASRVALLSVEEPGGPAKTMFVLDVGSDEPRTDFTHVNLPTPGEAPPVLREGPGEIVICLCAIGSATWYLALDVGEGGASRLDAGQREQLLFFAGECAGLLLHHGVGEEEGSSSPAPEGDSDHDRDGPLGTV